MLMMDAVRGHFVVFQAARWSVEAIGGGSIPRQGKKIVDYGHSWG